MFLFSGSEWQCGSLGKLITPVEEMPCSQICIRSASWLHLQPVYHILSEFDLRDFSSQRDEKLPAG